MGVEVAVNGEAKATLHDQENGKVDEPIKFGSHGADEQGEATKAAHAHLPNNVNEEWPEEPQVINFWFVKYRLYEDPKLKAEINEQDKELQKLNRRISQIYEVLPPKVSEKNNLFELLKSLGAEDSQYGMVMSEKRQEMKPLQDALGTLRGPGRGVGICSTEKELNDLIQSLEYQIQHESLSLKEEKQIVREIKELKATRPKVVANNEMRTKIQDSLGKKEVIQDQVKLLGTDLDEVRKQRQELKGKMDQLGSQYRALKDEINKLRDDLKALEGERATVRQTIEKLRKKRDEGNACFFANRGNINKAKELAAQKDVEGLETFVNEEVEKFMNEWNTGKAFRHDYEKRILLSLDQRQLSRDGRMRNPDEKPLVMAEAPKPAATPAVAKAAPISEKEDPKKTSKAENLSAPKAQKESKNNGSKDSKTSSEQAVEEEDVFVVEKPKKDAVKEKEVDQTKLREMKKEEEKEKQRQALERKKKLQEKAAAKAALRAQKEAEKKQKEREKKLKKKEAASGQEITEEEAAEKEPEAADLEKSEIAEEVVETSAPRNAREQRDSSLRSRKSVKSRGALPKAILKKKKSNNYWIWGSAAAAAVLVLVLLVLGYTYFL